MPRKWGQPPLLTDSSGDAGSSIFAGSIFTNNTLEVGGNAQFWNGVSINGNLSSGNLNIVGNGYFSGNVGIGTTAPGAKLDVQGIIKFGNSYLENKTGTNPQCTNGFVMYRKWTSKTCDDGYGANCTTPAGWGPPSLSCDYRRYDSPLLCTADSWTEVICIGN